MAIGIALQFRDGHREASGVLAGIFQVTEAHAIPTESTALAIEVPAAGQCGERPVRAPDELKLILREAGLTVVLGLLCRVKHALYGPSALHISGARRELPDIPVILIHIPGGRIRLQIVIGRSDQKRIGGHCRLLQAPPFGDNLLGLLVSQPSVLPLAHGLINVRLDPIRIFSGEHQGRVLPVVSPDSPVLGVLVPADLCRCHDLQYCAGT